jgi:hypothetical protein
MASPKSPAAGRQLSAYSPSICWKEPPKNPYSQVSGPFLCSGQPQLPGHPARPQRIAEMGGSVLAIEKERPHVPLERAIMAVRFNDAMIGTQFHPEADPTGMSMYLGRIANRRPEKKRNMVDRRTRLEEKWKSMITQLETTRTRSAGPFPSHNVEEWILTT